jgi:hypothetical protein
MMNSSFSRSTGGAVCICWGGSDWGAHWYPSDWPAATRSKAAPAARSTRCCARSRPAQSRPGFDASGRGAAVIVMRQANSPAEAHPFGPEGKPHSGGSGPCPWQRAPARKEELSDRSLMRVTKYVQSIEILTCTQRVLLLLGAAVGSTAILHHRRRELRAGGQRPSLPANLRAAICFQRSYLVLLLRPEAVALNALVPRTICMLCECCPMGLRLKGADRLQAIQLTWGTRLRSCDGVRVCAVWWTAALALLLELRTSGSELHAQCTPAARYWSGERDGFP